MKFADQKGGFKHEKGQIAPIREAIRLHLKAEIGRQLFSETAKYQILNQADPCIAKTRALLLQKDPLGVLNKK